MRQHGFRIGRSRQYACVVMISCLAFLSQASSAQPSPASGGGEGCNPGRNPGSGKWYDGMFENEASVGAVDASIEVYSPYVHPGSDTSAWVMLSNVNTVNYAQVGWDEEAYSHRYNFTEYGYDNGKYGHYTFSYPSSPIGSQVDFKVTYNPSLLAVKFWQDGVKLQELDDPTFGTPDVAQIYSEIHDWDSQMPGGYDAAFHEVFEDLETWYPAGGSGSYHTGSATVDFPPSFGGVSPAPGTSDVSDLQTWDKKCPS